MLLRQKPRGAVPVSPVNAGQLLLDVPEGDTHGGAPVEVAQLPDAVGEVGAGIARPALSELPVRDGSGTVEVEVFRCVLPELLKDGIRGLCLTQIIHSRELTSVRLSASANAVPASIRKIRLSLSCVAETPDGRQMPKMTLSPLQCKSRVAIGETWREDDILTVRVQQLGRCRLQARWCSSGRW